MSKHDEPWTIAERSNAYYVNDQLGSVVAKAWDGECARLIAAAPELLQWVLAYRDRMSDDEGELAKLLARIEHGP